jgi:hypothetical protein
VARGVDCNSCRNRIDGVCDFGHVVLRKRKRYQHIKLHPCEDYELKPKQNKCENCGELDELTKYHDEKLCRNCLITDDTKNQDPPWRQHSSGFVEE